MAFLITFKESIRARPGRLLPSSKAHPTAAISLGKQSVVGRAKNVR